MKGKTGEGKKTRALARKARRTSRKAKIPVTDVTVTFRHVEPTAAIREYAERKLSHLARFLRRACSAHLILSVDKFRQGGEVTVKSGNLTVVAQEETRDLYSVIDLLADKVGRQLKSHLGKAKTKKVRASSTGEILSAAEPGAPPLSHRH
ncbi:MAG: ribosome hibernation-promoting factor, HPF/YfiA family [Chthoniobacterales bacterium]